MAQRPQELWPGTLELLVLKTLGSGPLHGYAIVREIQRRAGDELVIEEGSLYPALHRMERRGWIEAEWGASEANRRAKFYRLTKSGRAQMRSRSESWSRLNAAIGRVLEAESAARPAEAG